MSATTLDLDPSLGALQIGGFICTFLFGILTVQAYMYYSNFPSDSVYYKIQVAFVWLGEIGQIICIIHTLYVITVKSYGNPQILVKPPLSLLATPFLYGFIAPVVQMFYALRIYKISQKLYIPALSLILSFCGGIGNMTSAGMAIKMKRLTIDQIIGRLDWLLTLCIFLRLATDVLTAATLVIHLYRRRQDAGFPSTLRMLDKLIKWTLETALITAVISTIKTIYFFKMKYSYIWVAIVFVDSLLFANSFLVALNSRRTLRAMEDTVFIGTEFGHASAYRHNHPPTSLGGVSIEFARTVATDTSRSRTAQGNGAKPEDPQAWKLTSGSTGDGGEEADAKWLKSGLIIESHQLGV